MKAKFPLVLAGIAGLAAIFAWREGSFARRAVQTLAALSGTNEKLATAFRETETRLTAAEQARVNLQSALDSFQKAKPLVTAAPARKPRPDAAAAMAEWIKGEEEHQKDPQVQLRQLAAARTKLAARYGALWRAVLEAQTDAGSNRAVRDHRGGEDRTG